MVNMHFFWLNAVFTCKALTKIKAQNKYFLKNNNKMTKAHGKNY